MWKLIFLISACGQCARSYDAWMGETTTTTTKTHPEDSEVTTESTEVATTNQSFRQSRWYKREDDDAMDDDDHHDDDEDADHVDPGETKALSSPKGEYWGGYYDFLINEGSYKFWAVFQLATAALLIYSGFAALYYAKINPSTNDDYEDYFLRRRRRRRRDAFLGLEPENFQLIIDAVFHEYQSHRE